MFPVSGFIKTLCINTSLLRKVGFAKFRVGLSSRIADNSPISKDIVTSALVSVG